MKKPCRIKLRLNGGFVIMAGLLILGAGGHGKVVAEIALMLNKWANLAFLDDNSRVRTVNNIPVIGKLEDYHLYKNDFTDAFVALGNNHLRLEWINKLYNIGYRIPTITHPFTSISKFSNLGMGTVVMPGAVINTGATVGNACIINTSSSIDHDCVLEDGIHISPGVHLGGTVSIGSCTWACLGSQIINNVNIGRNVVIAAGAVVIDNIPDNVMVSGIPAMIKKRFGDEQ
jgi:sugar O-acyltransferase (sialic acid O-acetyltransferase NeuD family)